MSAPADHGQHAAVFHETMDGMLDAVEPFLTQGWDQAEATVLAVDTPTLDVIKDRVAGDTRLAVIAEDDVFRNPAHALTAYRKLAEAEERAGNAGVRLIARPMRGSRNLEWATWGTFEHACNRALEDSPVRLLCLYDLATLPAAAVQLGRDSHPQLLNGGHVLPNPAYSSTMESVRRIMDTSRDPLEHTAPDLVTQDVTSPGQARTALRNLLNAGAAGASLTAQDFTTVVSELVQNAVQHGRAPVQMRAWVRPDRLLCAVTDQGPGFANPTVGLNQPPDGMLSSGAGLWLVNQLADTVTFRHDKDGFTVLVGVAIRA